MLSGIHPNPGSELQAEFDTLGHGVADTAPRVVRTDESRPDANLVLRTDGGNDHHSTEAAR